MELTWNKVQKYFEVEQRDFKDFAKVPYAMAEGKYKVSGNAMKLFVIFYSLSRFWKGAQPKKIKENISQAAIARKLEVTTKTVSLLTKELYNKGWIDVEYTGRNNKITLYGSPVRLIND